MRGVHQCHIDIPLCNTQNTTILGIKATEKSFAFTITLGYRFTHTNHIHRKSQQLGTPNFGICLGNE